MTTAIELRGVSVFYGEVVGLSAVDLHVETGITGLVGPNGSGKSTLMRVLTGLVAPREGTAQVLGGAPFDDPTVRARIAFVPATENFFERVSARRNLEVAFLARGLSRAAARTRADEALAIAGLASDAGRRYGTWSRGMRQRLKLGLALASEAELVLLDEPFLGVDPPSRRKIGELVGALGATGRTVLLSSHVLHEIESLTDRVVVLAHGRVLGAGLIAELLEELRDRHPHRIEVQLADPRALAAALVALPHVRELKLVGSEALEFVTERPDVAYRELTEAVAATGLAVRAVTSRDSSLAAVFEQVTAAGARRL